MSNMLLDNHIADEEKDYHMYMEMAEEFEEEGHSGAAAILRDIAHEEQIHAKHLRDIKEKELYTIVHEKNYSPINAEITAF